MSMLDADQLDRAIAMWASFAFSIANLETKLPSAASTADIVADDAALLAALGPAPLGSTPTPAVCGVNWSPSSPAPPPSCPKFQNNAPAPAFAWVIAILATAIISGAATRFYTLRTLRRSAMYRGGLAACDSYEGLLSAEELEGTTMPSPQELAEAQMAAAAPRPPLTL
jgi:hypothetical protein